MVWAQPPWPAWCLVLPSWAEQAWGAARWGQQDEHLQPLKSQLPYFLALLFADCPSDLIPVWSYLN